MSKINQVYGIGQALIPSLPPPIPFENAPTSNQTNYSIGQVVFTPPNSPSDFYMYAGDGNWVQFIGGGGSGVISVNGSNGVTASPTSGSVVVSGVNATTSNIGVASFNPADFTVSGGGQVSLIGTMPNSYTNVVGPVVYPVLDTDYFLSLDLTLGAITLEFPNTTSPNRQFIVKDRLGLASPTKTITLTTPGGVTTIDQMNSRIYTNEFQAVEMLFHAGVTNNYEIF